MTGWPRKPIRWIDAQGTLCISIVFTWDLPRVKEDITQGNFFACDRILVGGPAVRLLPGFFSDLDFVAEGGGDITGVLQQTNPLATRTTTGCPRSCGFCGVKKIEPIYRELAEWPDLPILCDNNILAASPAHFDRVCDRLEKHGWGDFNQGVDARLLDEHHAERFQRIPGLVIRMALDHSGMKDQWQAAYERLRSAGVQKRRIMSYAIIGFNSDPDEAWDRCNWIESHKVKALPMWFHALDAMKKNAVSAEQMAFGWNDFERRRIMQWFYWHKKAV